MTTPATHPLAKALDALGWTQAELARRSGVVQPTISAVLSGKRGGRFSPASAAAILAAVQKSGAPRAARLDLAALIFPPKSSPASR
jgi:transcriptional regulator with XRE-family HTH domain